MNLTRRTPQGVAERGFALIAVLIVLGILVALAAPFLASMGNGDAASRTRVDVKAAELLSESARDLVLAAAARSYAAVDETPAFDDRSEFPDRLELPRAFESLRADGFDRHLLSAEVEDLQSRIDLDTATPLLIANLLGLAARLDGEHEPDADELRLDAVRGLPEAGWVVVDRELIRYGGIEDGALVDLQRGQRLDLGFASAEDHTLPDGALVLDFRAVLAVAESFYFRHPDRTRREGYETVEEVARIAGAGFGTFSPEEVAVLRRTTTASALAEQATTWGKPERVFEDLEPGDHVLRVRSAAFLGGGSVVRIRSLDGEKLEYGLVWSTEVPQSYPRTVNLPGQWFVNLLLGVRQSFKGGETVVEALVPTPVNVNTARREVLAALIENVRPTRRLGGHLRLGSAFKAPFSRDEAQALADEILALRGDPIEGFELPGDEEPRPFVDFRDFAERVFARRLREGSALQRYRFLTLYHDLRSGRAGEVRMGTAPICFASGPLVAYRAAAARLRASGKLGARVERRGVAVAVPDETLDLVLGTQSDFEEAFRLDRHAPWYLTHPINTGARLPVDRGTTPSSRTVAEALAMAFAEFGVGQPRFPSRDDQGAGFRAEPATTPYAYGRGRVSAHWDFWNSLDPEGRNLAEEGPFVIRNSGPRARGDNFKNAKQRAAAGNGAADHSPSFPFSVHDGITARFAISFWFRPRRIGEQILFDLAADEPDRNRISVRIDRDPRGGRPELVLEVLDEAGLDPDLEAIRRAGTSPERTAGAWRVPLDEIDLQPEVWFHASLSADGNRPGQLALTIDGVPRGEPDLRTYLAQALPAYKRPQGVRSFREDEERFTTVRVESTEGFPPRGVLRIGLELFEYTSKDDTAFYCKFLDSMGGRAARMALAEFRPEIPVDEQGRPTVDLADLPRGADLDVAPDHPAGAAVELYGYSVPIYRSWVAQPDQGRLLTALGPFAVARVANANAQDIVVPWGPRGQARAVGVGLQETDRFDLELADPLPDDQYPPRQPASDAIASTFSTQGGYALLMQEQFSWRGDRSGAVVVTGGIELIRYGGRNGAKLTGIERGVTLPVLAAGQHTADFDGTARKFVTQWDPSMRIGTGRGRGIEMYKLPQLLTYVVPISIPVAGSFLDPTAVGRSEWVQIYPRGDERDTEWVRYDYIADGRFLLRTNVRAWHRVLGQLTRNLDRRRLEGIVGRFGGGAVDSRLLTQNIYPRVVRTNGTDYIGYLDDVEVEPRGYPQIHLARIALGFRGDPLTGTTSHHQEAGALVTQCHRLELDWGNYGALTGRVGRNDRVALVSGSKADGSSRPAVDWHTVNWVARRYGRDRRERGGDGNTRRVRAEMLGAWPFQLVAFKEPLRQLFIGPPERDPFRDTRLIDRVVKFPSGELPAAFAEAARLGSSRHRDAPDSDATIDEVAAVWRQAVPVVLDEPLAADATEMVTRPDLWVTSQGAVVLPKDLTASYPEQGGLVMVDGEILAYESRADGRFRIARGGRGLLGTEPRAHDEGAMVAFLEQIPAAILTRDVVESSADIFVKDLGFLPRHGGTLLLGGGRGGPVELLHYTWTVGNVLLQMPIWFDPEREDTQGRGLLRGRYGTRPIAARAGEPVIAFPFRYWDRHHERSDDPELGYFQITRTTGPAWLRGIYWEEEHVDPSIDVHCLVRVDGAASFAADPRTTPGLFLFTQGSLDDGPVPIGYQGSRLEARFFTVYRPGAFDPLTFRAHAWKKAVTVRNVLIELEGEGRILTERVVSR